MEIKYLKILEENPTYTYSRTGHIIKLESLSDTEIINLEAIYNDGKDFPVVLKELLLLAGNYCYVLDYGPADNQQGFQENARKFLSHNAHKDHIILRPFFALDQYGGDQFLFVYLDEDADDPMVYQATPYAKEGKKWIHECDTTLTTLVNNTMDLFLKGYNPF